MKLWLIPHPELSGFMLYSAIDIKRCIFAFERDVSDSYKQRNLWGKELSNWVKERSMTFPLTQGVSTITQRIGGYIEGQWISHNRSLKPFFSEEAVAKRKANLDNDMAKLLNTYGVAACADKLLEIVNARA